MSEIWLIKKSRDWITSLATAHVSVPCSQLIPSSLLYWHSTADHVKFRILQERATFHGISSHLHDSFWTVCNSVPLLIGALGIVIPLSLNVSDSHNHLDQYKFPVTFSSIPILKFPLHDLHRAFEQPPKAQEYLAARVSDSSRSGTLSISRVLARYLKKSSSNTNQGT